MRGGVSWRSWVGVGRARGLGAVLCAIVLVAMAVAPVSASARRHGRRHTRSAHACRNADTPVRGASAHAMRAAVLCLVNQQRAARGLPGLHASRLLNRSAQGWSDSMVRGDFFSHGSNFAARISAVGFLWSSAGENIATGFPTPRRVVDAWMHSTGHCQNILNPTFRDVGTGVDPAGVKAYGGTPGTWTQDFALPRGQHPLSGSWAPSNHCPY
jgi:uncharacterized protein YkwD